MRLLYSCDRMFTERHRDMMNDLYHLSISRYREVSNVYREYIMVFNNTQKYFSYIMAVSFIGGGNLSTRRKPQILHKLLTNFIT